MSGLISSRLDKCEKVISRGMATFADVGRALLEIRDDRLYRKEFKTFEAYCQERWGMVRRTADNLISSSEVVEKMRAIALTLPATESVARPLTKLPEAKQAEVWEEAVATAPDGKVTAKHVSNVVRKAMPKKEKARMKRGSVKASSEIWAYIKDVRTALDALSKCGRPYRTDLAVIHSELSKLSGSIDDIKRKLTGGTE